MSKQPSMINLFGCILVLSFLFFVPAVSICAESTGIEAVLNALEKKYSLKSFQAEFSQVTTLAALDLADESSGKVWFSHPGKMKWQYILPDPHAFITNGDKLWFYQPEAQQVSIGKAAGFFKTGAGGAFLSDITLIRTNYTARIKEKSDKDILVELIPKTPDPDIAAIDIQILKKNYEIRQVTTRNQFGDITKFDFYNIRFTPLEPELFEFTPPEGITTIQLDETP